MTLPVELLQRRRAADRYDAVIVGAGIPGLVCGCLLAGAGLRVIVIERRKRPGGAWQTLSYQGYAVDLAPPLFDSPAFEQILEAAGVKDHCLCVLAGSGLRVASSGEHGLQSAPRVAPVPGTVPSPSTLDAVRELFGVPPRVFATLGSVYENLAAAGAEQIDEWRRQDLETWLAASSLEPAVRSALLRNVAMLGADLPARTSLAALALQARDPSHARLAVPGDQPVAGVRGIVQALVDRLIESGGELRLGTQAIGMAIDAHRFVALEVRREEQPFAEEIAADRCVLAIATEALPQVLPEEPLRALAAPVETESRVLLGAAFALEEEVAFADAEEAWVVRVLPSGRGGAVPPGGSESATFFRASAAAPRIAPPGRGLVLAWSRMAAGAARDGRLIFGRVERLRAVLAGLHGSAPPGLEWQRYWVSSGAYRDAFAVARMAALVPGFEGLHLANEDVEVPAAASATAPLVTAAAAARHVAERILAGG